MKVRNFYPRQALRKLQGEHAELSKGQKSALKVLMLKGRKMGIAVALSQVVDKNELLGTKIVLTPAI